MTEGIEFLERVYGQLHEAGIVRSKGEFSERLLGKSPSYLTSMRAKQRVISSDVVMGLGDNLLAEIDDLSSDQAHAEIRAVLRRAVAQVNYYLADQTVPAGIAFPKPQTGEKTARSTNGLLGWFRALVTASPHHHRRDIRSTLPDTNIQNASLGRSASLGTSCLQGLGRFLIGIGCGK